ETGEKARKVDWARELQLGGKTWILRVFSDSATAKRGSLPLDPSCRDSFRPVRSRPAIPAVYAFPALQEILVPWAARSVPSHLICGTRSSMTIPTSPNARHRG